MIARMMMMMMTTEMMEMLIRMTGMGVMIIMKMVMMI
jgi:hypothetical protein